MQVEYTELYVAKANKYDQHLIFEVCFASRVHFSEKVKIVQNNTHIFSGVCLCFCECVIVFSRVVSQSLSVIKACRQQNSMTENYTATRSRKKLKRVWEYVEVRWWRTKNREKNWKEGRERENEREANSAKLSTDWSKHNIY